MSACPCRPLLKWGVALLLIIVLTGSLAVSAQPPEVPTEFRSSAGTLNVTLQAEEGNIRIGDLDLHGATYNGNYAGPVLRVRPGDTLNIRLINRLPQPTNLHFHGIRTSPLGNSDNVHIAVPPGGNFAYSVHIPANQPPGLYWYHAHIHGISEQQIMQGLSGALVVEDPIPSGMTERLFVLKEVMFDDDTENPRIDNDLHGVVQSVNGALDTHEAIQAGETQLWRFTNQSANRAFHIALQGHRFRIVAEDGERTVGERDAEVLDISPASRVEVLVDGGTPGRYALLSKGVMTGTGAARTADRVLGHLEVSGENPSAMHALPAAAPPPDLRSAHIDASRTVAFTQTNTLKPKDQRFYVNGRTFDPNRIDVRVPLGSVEEWTIRNDSDDMHVFHIHQVGFQVTRINEVDQPFTGHVDVVRIPERGSVTLRIPFTDPTIVGRFMFHCHVLKHEDKGMMAQIEVYDPVAANLSNRISLLYRHVWWWLHGVPWSLCGLGFS
jgi:suppressor of ftsI